VMNNLEDEFYFNLVKGFTVYMILFAILMSIASRNSISRIENESGN
jgi:hypothetical protein